jgi:hypothetical protein
MESGGSVCVWWRWFGWFRDSQIVSGADDLPTTVVPSNHTPTWDSERDWCVPRIAPRILCTNCSGGCSLSLSAPDVMVFLHREYSAFGKFLEKWASCCGDDSEATTLRDQAAASRVTAAAIQLALNTHLWSEELGHYVAYDVKRKVQVTNRTFLMAFPMYDGLCTPEQAAKCLEQLQAREFSACPTVHVLMCAVTETRHVDGLGRAVHLKPG